MLKPAEIEALAAAAPGVRIEPAGPAYLEEPRGRVRMAAAVLALPEDVGQVASLVRACGRLRFGLVPRGGGTGLVLGQVVPGGPAPVILSLERMARVRGIWPEENVMTVEAGAILADVQRAAAEAGRLFPLALAAQGSARIGGNLATNAGGVTVLRYGNARDLCLGIEAVLPDGSVMAGLTRLRKDNTGYDLRHLLIGSEGTLGVITAAALKLAPMPAARATAVFVVADPAAALALLARAEARAGGLISAFELIHGQGLRFLDEVMPDVRQPFAARPDWMVLMELGLPAGIAPEAVMAGIYEAAAAEGLVGDAVIAQSEAQRAEFWRLREALPEANRRIGAIASHDVALPLGALAEFISGTGAALAAIGEVRINCFGHVGDGNLHYNVFPAPGRARADYADRAGAISRLVHDRVAALGGSVSAEHGIGRLKVAELARYADPAELAAMRAIKAALDPLGIMNPGAVLG